MKKLTLIITTLILAFSLNAQDWQLRDNIDMDSLFKVVITKYPKYVRKEIKKEYFKGSKEQKIGHLYFMLLPQSSKAELIENYENKKEEILYLKEEYLKLVPKGYSVYISIEAADPIFTIPELITIKIFRKRDKNGKLHDADIELNMDADYINLTNGSQVLAEALEFIGWTEQTLTTIKFLLDNANCVSINNEEMTTIGFSIGGFSWYAYMLFENELTEEQMQKYNDGCNYIYYKDNVVLEYDGGAAGRQCFEE